MGKDRKPTPEEIAANVAKAEAEAQWYREQARREAAKADVAVLEAEKERRIADYAEAEDRHHRIYRFTRSVEASSAKTCMQKLTKWSRMDPKCDMEVVFSSPGGGVHAGLALFDHIRMLSSEGHRMTTGAQGMAASMAGILLQAGDHRWMSRECWVLIHRASFGALGSTYEIEDKVKLIKRIEKRIINIFKERSTLSRQKIQANWERKDWWLDSDECLEHELVDEVRA